MNASRFAGLGSKVLFGLLLLPVLLTCASAESGRGGSADPGSGGGGSVWLFVRPNQLAIATVAVPYSAHLVPQGGTAPYKFAFNSGSIPPGLYFNTATGTVAGTPTTAGSFSFRINLSDASDRNPVTIYMIVNPANPGTPGITVSVSPGSASVASSGTQQFSAVVAHASNPAVTWTASTGTITSSGMFTAPSVTVATTATVTATSVADPSKHSQSTITVNPVAVPVSIAVSPSSASVASAGTQQFSAVVGHASNTAVTWTATGGTINSSGMFTAASVTVATTATVTATSVADPTKHAQATITVNPAQVAVSVTVSPTSSSIISAGTQQFTAIVTNTSNTAVTWTAAGGTITSSGMFTAPSVTASTTATITATSVADATKFARSTVTINPAAATVSVSVSPNAATLTSGNSQQFTALVQGSSNTAVTWSATAGTVSGSGLFTSPSVSSSTNVTVTATSVADPTKTSSSAVVVSPGTSALSITTSGLPGGQAASPYSYLISATGGSAPYRWGISSGSLPQGLTLSSSGQVSGTPTQVGQFTFAVQVTDAGNTTVSKTFAVAVLMAQLANYDGPAELPRVYMLTTMADTPAPGTTTLVSPGGNLQTALNNANCGDTIELAAGATFAGQFTLPAKPCTDQNWIIVRTSAPDSALPPEGSRMTPCYAGVSSLPGRPSFNCSSTSNVLAKVVYSQTGGSGPFRLAAGANHYRLLGLEITRATGTGFIGPLVSTVSGTADHLVLDRVWLHGAPSDETLSGIDMGLMNYAALVDSYAADFHCTSATGACTDAHVVSGGIGNVVGGPYRIVDNFLEAAGENILFGGGSATVTPADIEIRLNHFFKPWTWKTGQPGFVGGTGNNPFMVKNHLELKNAQRVLIEGNIFENNWGGFSQAGYSILLTPKNQAGGNGANLCPLCAVTDVTIRYNTISHVGGGISLADLNGGNGGAALAGQRYSIHDVTIDDVSASKYVGNGNLLMVFNGWVANSLNNVSINHITGFSDPSATFLMLGNSNNAPPMYGFTMNNSIIGQSQYPIWSTGGTANCAVSNVPLTSLTTCFPAGYSFTHNVLLAVNQTNYPTSKWPAGNFLQPTAAAAGFVNFNGGNGGNYQLLPSSPYKSAATDGTDLGADISRIQSLTANVY